MLEDADGLSPVTTFIETVNSTVDPQLLYQCIDEDAVVIEVTFGPRGSMAFALTREGFNKYTTDQHAQSTCADQPCG
ncbi:hypothetical protein N7522_001714 [Penicillium canescens]|nr:hypothetical protein N7522_001714 [Penicillium canescens]